MLENVPDDQKDWHPRSNNQVLDLVHPSLYCIVYGRTLFAAGHEARVHHSEPPEPEPYIGYNSDGGFANLFLSKEFSWIPTDFAISLDGKLAKALGYINNLSPSEHAGLYSVIAQFVARFVPLWERVLGETKIGSDFHLPLRVPATSCYTWVSKEVVDEQTQEGIEGKGNNKEDDGEEDDEEDDEDWDEHKNDELVLPLVTNPFVPYKVPEPINLRGRNIQVIVKLANIYLVRVS